MNFAKSNKYFRLFALGLFIVVFSMNGYTQSKNKKTDHEKERFEADAAAVAYINCKYDIAKHNSESQPQDIQLQNELKDIVQLKLEFDNQVMGKYWTPVEEFNKFKKEMDQLKEELKICIKYQNILNANEKLKELKTQ